jgi:glycosyltransferase involved in cell wall biosynthesis
MGVNVVFADQHFGPQRGDDADGKKMFTIWDAYQNADLATYPSSYEGFGNAFLESVYYKCPIFSNRYAIYRTDIEPCGFDVILMEDFLTKDVVEEVRRVLEDKSSCDEIVQHNYDIAKYFFSYKRLETELHALLSSPQLTHGVDHPPAPR